MSVSGLSPHTGGEDRGAGIIATTVVVSFLASSAVALRFATRTWIVRSIGWDDYTILMAAFGIIISSGLVIVEVHYGLGRHKADLTQWQYIEFMKYSYGEWIQTFQTLMLNKISICFFLLRIPVEKHLIRPIQVAVVVLIVSNIVLTLLWIFQCNPISRAWNEQTPGRCFTDAQLQRIIMSQALISIISDFGLALFPILLLWKVQIPLRIKAGLCSLMGLGLITAACCIVRTIMNWQNVNSDPSWASIDNWYWRSWEVCIGIVAACIPTLRPAYRTVSKGISAYFSRRSMRQNSDFALVEPSNTRRTSADPKSEAQQITRPQASYSSGFGAAAQAVSAEADNAEKFGVGVEGFPMKPLPGDKRTADQGIKKTTRIESDVKSANRSQKSLELGDVERGFRNREFL